VDFFKLAAGQIAQSTSEAIEESSDRRGPTVVEAGVDDGAASVSVDDELLG